MFTAKNKRKGKKDMADINELIQVRREKMQKLIDNGVHVHP